MGTRVHGYTYTGEQRKYVARARGSGAVGHPYAGSRVRGIAGRAKGGGMGNFRLQSKRGDPSHETTFPFFNDPNGNKVSNWVGEQENVHIYLPNLPDRFHHFDFVTYTNIKSTTYVILPKYHTFWFRNTLTSSVNNKVNR